MFDTLREGLAAPLSGMGISFSSSLFGRAGSLILGFLAQRKKVEEIKKKYPPKPGAKRRTFFSSFNEGLQFICDRMADAAGREHIRTGAGATALERAGEGWRVTLEGGEVIDGDALIVATEAWASTILMRDVDEELADVLGAQSYGLANVEPQAVLALFRA